MLGDYAILAPLGYGGVANVYLGEHAGTNERVALKILDSSHRDHAEIGPRLLAEHSLLGRVRHSGLIEARGASRGDDGLPYLVLEYLDGESLDTFALRGPLELAAVLSIAAQVASACAALHAAGITHCDLKPDNVIVLREAGAGGRPRIKVIDLGVARTSDDPTHAAATIDGTPHYMAPEQWRGHPVPRSDVYGLGCVVFELLTGDVPFTGAVPTLMTKHTDTPPPRPSSVRATIPAALDGLVLRMLAKDPAMRPSMNEVHGELAAIACGLAAPLEATG